MSKLSKLEFKQLLTLQIMKAEKKGRTYRPPRMAKPRRPLNIQREYTKDLGQMVKYLRELYTQYVYPKLPEIVAKAQLHKTVNDSLKRDAYSDDVENAMNNVQIRFQSTYSKPVKAGIARNIGNKINKFSGEILENQVKKMVGTTIFVSEPWLNDRMAAFVKENVDLITKWPDALKTQAEEIIMRGARTGTAPSEIESELRDRIDVVEGRYDMIARDQVNKFNGQLSRIRHEDLGITRYTWDTSHDERVRPMHRELEGEVFSYDDPPITNPQGERNNPGEDYNCRCADIPYIEDIVGDISDEIQPEDEAEFDTFVEGLDIGY